MKTKNVLTPREAAVLLGLGKTTVIEWCQRGILPAIRIDSRWYLKRPELVAAGFLSPEIESAARSGEDRAAGEGR